MNYEQIYNSLIEKRKIIPVTGYTEKHHILPKSMGGSDDPTNLVVLTGREHWVAHLLLYKIYRNRQTIHACNMMAMRCEERGIPFIRSSHTYQRIRIEHAKLMSKTNKITHKGTGNSQYGTMWIYNIELQENKKIPKTETIPLGWNIGRVLNWDKFARECPCCGKEFYSRDNKKYCSTECRKKNIKDLTQTTIDQNKNKIVKMYKAGCSLNKICKSLGWPGAQGGYYTRLAKSLKAWSPSRL